MARSGFTEKQKAWIQRRDMKMSGGCVLCGESKKTLHIHHISPFRFSTVVLGWSIERTNLPTNGISVCEKCHVGKGSRHPEDAIHADTERARRLYKEDRNSFIKMQAERDRLCSNGKKYWNSTHDDKLAKMAVANSLRYVYIKGKEDPPPWNF